MAGVVGQQDNQCPGDAYDGRVRRPVELGRQHLPSSTQRAALRRLGPTIGLRRRRSCRTRPQRCSAGSAAAAPSWWRDSIQVGIGHAGETVTVAAVGDRFEVRDDDRLLVDVGRTTTKPIARFKARKPELPRPPAPRLGSRTHLGRLERSTLLS